MTDSQMATVIMERRLRTCPDLWPGFSVESFDDWQSKLRSLAASARAVGVDDRPLLSLLKNFGDPKSVMEEVLLTLERLSAAVAADSSDDPAHAAPTTAGLAALTDDSMMNHVDIASALGLPSKPLRKRLDRWRCNNADGWQEVTEP